MESPIVTEGNVLQHVAVLITRVEANEKSAEDQRRVNDLRHEQNRAAIHDIKDNQQTMIDLIHANQVDMMKCLQSISEKFGTIDSKLKGYAGYVAGGVVVGGAAFEAFRMWLENHK